ncbi:hypothetical protein OG928_14385 [Embleya sp. NBC_00896]|nr:hypothetical protein OG928_14385 [Embleya sp. NBC_00896]
MRAHIVRKHLKAYVGPLRKDDQYVAELIGEGLPTTDRIAKRRVMDDEPQRPPYGRERPYVPAAFYSAGRTTPHLLLRQGR